MITGDLVERRREVVEVDEVRARPRKRKYELEKRNCGDPLAGVSVSSYYDDFGETTVSENGVGMCTGRSAEGPFLLKASTSSVV